MVRLNSGFGPGNSLEATPVVQDGVMYVTTSDQDVFAFDAKSGVTRWEYRPNVGRRTPGIRANRGVALGEGMVFVGQSAYVMPPASGRSTNGLANPPGGNESSIGVPAARLMALDQKTGRVRWAQDLGEDLQAWQGKFVTAPPFYYKGLVYIYLSGGDAGARGRVTAHDAETGKEVWRFYTTPGPGEFGNDTWEGDSWKTGGGSVWVHPALDAELGLLYVSTGNPWPVSKGSQSGGDNLFTCSGVAIDARTGKYRWHFQTVHHDIWDFDLPVSVILFDQVYDGVMRKALAAHTKQGLVFVLDRITGKPLIPVDEKPVPQEPRQKTAATQPIPQGDPTAPQCAEPVKGYNPGCMFTPFWNTGNIAQPSAAGDWAPGAYDPVSGYLYFTTGISTRVFRAGTEEVVNGRRVSLNSGRYGPIGTRQSGRITAVDSRTNRAVWHKELPYLAGFGSGVLATAGGLLFHGGADGFFRAFASKTGEELWRFQTGFGADAPASTYEIDGEQYVAIASGGNREGANEAKGDILWTFKLGGRVNPLNGPPAPTQILSFDTSDARLGPLVQSTTITIGRTWNVAANKPGDKDEYNYGPKRTVVPVGSMVTFVNEGDMPHTATDQGGTWDTGMLAPQQKTTLKFDKPGEYIYFCLPHPWMIGQLVVQ